MARIPNAESAIFDVRKLADYCLSPVHPRGRHKARVFRDALQLNRNDAEWLRAALLEGASPEDAIQLIDDDRGVRWRVDILVRRHGKSAVVRTVWIVLGGERVPRFVTCWVL